MNSSTPSLTNALCASTPRRPDSTELVLLPPTSVQALQPSTSRRSNATEVVHSPPTSRRSNDAEVVRLPYSLTEVDHTSKLLRSDDTKVIRTPVSLVETLHASTPVRSSPLVIETHHMSKSHQSNDTKVIRTPALLTETLHAPKPLRADGTEVVRLPPSKTPLKQGPSSISLLNHCHFPRALTSQGKTLTSSMLKRQLPILPIVHQSEEKRYSTEEVYDLLDHLDNHSSTHFTDKLNRLSLSTVIQQHHERINGTTNQEDFDHEEENDNYDDEEKENIFPHLFESSSSTTTQEKLFFSKLDIDMENPNNLLLYTMTLSTVQISASILLPYSILNGRRPLLKCSKQTNFRRIQSKQPRHTCQVTAIESCSTSKQLQPNDIILKVFDLCSMMIQTNESISFFLF